MKANQAAEQRATKVVDDVKEFLKTDMRFISTGGAPCDRAEAIGESREYRLAGDITTLLPIAQQQCGDTVEELSVELWRLLRTIEDNRIIIQTCLQILLGNADDETWLQGAIKEMENITLDRIDVTVDRRSNNLLQILKPAA
jgi:hypothetical protein